MTNLKNRLKSLTWRAAMMGLAVAVGFVADHIASLELPTYATVSLGLFLGEVSKFLNGSITSNSMDENPTGNLNIINSPYSDIDSNSQDVSSNREKSI